MFHDQFQGFMQQSQDKEKFTKFVLEVFPQIKTFCDDFKYTVTEILWLCKCQSEMLAGCMQALGKHDNDILSLQSEVQVLNNKLQGDKE